MDCSATGKTGDVMERWRVAVLVVLVVVDTAVAASGLPWPVEWPVFWGIVMVMLIVGLGLPHRRR